MKKSGATMEPQQRNGIVVVEVVLVVVVSIHTSINQSIYLSTHPTYPYRYYYFYTTTDTTTSTTTTTTSAYYY